MKPFGVNWIQGVLHDLQPIDGEQGAAQHPNGPGMNKSIQAGQQGLGLRPHVGKQQTPKLLNGVSIGGYFFSEAGVVGFIGLIQTFPFVPKFPAMVRASNASFCGNTVSK